MAVPSYRFRARRRFLGKSFCLNDDGIWHRRDLRSSASSPGTMSRRRMCLSSSMVSDCGTQTVSRRARQPVFHLATGGSTPLLSTPTRWQGSFAEAQTTLRAGVPACASKSPGQFTLLSFEAPVSAQQMLRMLRRRAARPFHSIRPSCQGHLLQQG